MTDITITFKSVNVRCPQDIVLNIAKRQAQDLVTVIGKFSDTQYYELHRAFDNMDEKATFKLLNDAMNLYRANRGDA